VAVLRLETDRAGWLSGTDSAGAAVVANPTAALATPKKQTNAFLRPSLPLVGPEPVLADGLIYFHGKKAAQKEEAMSAPRAEDRPL